MNTLQTILNSPPIYRPGLTLLQLPWQGAAVLAALGLLAIAFRKASSQLRYALSTTIDLGDITINEKDMLK